jgi:hypothetical protein
VAVGCYDLVSRLLFVCDMFGCCYMRCFVFHRGLWRVFLVMSSTARHDLPGLAHGRARGVIWQSGALRSSLGHRSNNVHGWWQ